MTSKLTRERLEEIANWNQHFDVVTYDEAREMARLVLAAMDSESGCLPLDYLQGHKDGLEWAAQLAEANHPETGDWLYDDPIELAKAIRKGPDMPPAQSVDSEPVAWTWQHREQWHVTNDEERARDLTWDGVKVEPLYRHAQQPVVPATLPCSVELKPGLIIGKGCKTETLLTALRHRADYNADIDAMTPEERAEHDASIEAFKAMLPQPAPVVPEMTAIVERLNDSGYEYEGGEVTPQNAATVVDILLQQLDDAVLGRNAHPAPVVLDDTKLRELFDSWFASDCSFDLSPEASEADNIAWRESYWYVWQRCRAAMLQAGNSPVIADGLIGAVNRLLDSDGSRGCYSAIRCGDAHDEIERLLAAAQKEEK
ncbi:hypothetical protein [Klebsiella michiganensis]|uniref:hypothetical protein n=1 Tax=Klebsiella michiganensis TaxID=1134687 RepID=UPI00255AC41B|nr:hypothetical protein [Klebsiella michiganensis]MDL4447723.1 hypothetical protein [Klebsiella michiganensis]MDL4489477.1 hypothetical protein [Klebsiella michiganensis]MDL4658221.1 hypothetical protein [Klebsiella michiganensis]